jgi:hypothetical protein
LKELLDGYFCYLSPDTRLLTVIDDSAGHRIVSSRDAAGNILIKRDSVKVGGGKPTIADVGEIDIFGLDGNDNISVDEANSPIGASVRRQRRRQRCAGWRHPVTTRLFDS